MLRLPALRRWLLLGAAVAVAAALLMAVQAGPSRADLSSQYAAGQQQAGRLQSAIQQDNSRIQGYQGKIGDLQIRLNAVEHSLNVQAHLLQDVSAQLELARERLVGLRMQYRSDRRALAAQLVADYESSPPTLVDVIVNSSGFQDLLNQVHDLNAVARANARAMHHVELVRAAVSAQARRLATTEARRRRATSAVLAERDQIAQLRLSIVNRELAVAHDKAQQADRLRSVQKTLARQAAKLQQEAAASAASSSGGVSPPPGGCANTPFVAHGGEFGFFPAAGTDYTVNQEPIIAARLDALGKALQLHLIGLSGYRSPQHSVEVGGFADDPHTRGEASDTPGVEGVPEATLEGFCLTRPFSGAAEADHIQEL